MRLRTTVINEDFNFPNISIPSLAEMGQNRIRACLAIENLLNPSIEDESGEDSSAESEISTDGPLCMNAQDDEDTTTLDEMDLNGSDASTLSSIDVTNNVDINREHLEASDSGSDMVNVESPRRVVAVHPSAHPFFLSQSSKKRPYTPSFLSDTSSNAESHVKKRRKDSQGMSKSALASRTLIELFQSGTLDMNKKKLENWKQKCRTKDPNVEFDKKNIAARHSKCGEFIKMKEPYNATRFNEHIKKCTPETRKKRPAAGTSSLWKWVGTSRTTNNNSSPSGSKQTLEAALETEPNYPCPGLTELDDSRIPKYLRRTGFVGGGARALKEIASDRFGKAFSELGEGKKQEVVDVQLHEHKWRNDHQGQRVFATKCKQRVQNPPLNLRAQPCDECTALLSNKRFTAILRKPTPDDKDFIYTNHRYRPRNLGIIYARTIGLREIIENPVR
jgi:hypothetical protein